MSRCIVTYLKSDISFKSQQKRLFGNPAERVSWIRQNRCIIIGQTFFSESRASSAVDETSASER